MIKSNLGDFNTPFRMNNREANKLVRVFIKNTLIYDYEKTGQSGDLAQLAGLLSQFSVVKFPVTVEAKHDTTCFLISPENIMAFVKTKEALLSYMSIEGLVIENLESYSLAWSGAVPDDFPEGVGNTAIISKDLSQHMEYVEPVLVGGIISPIPMQTIKSILGVIDSYFGSNETLAREAEIRAIEYPDFDNILKSELEDYIDTWNKLYPDNLIEPTGTLKQELINAIKAKLGLE